MLRSSFILFLLKHPFVYFKLLTQVNLYFSRYILLAKRIVTDNGLIMAHFANELFALTYCLKSVLFWSFFGT